jgi:hypothetical protein
MRFCLQRRPGAAPRRRPDHGSVPVLVGSMGTAEVVPNAAGIAVERSPVRNLKPDDPEVTLLLHRLSEN